MTRRATGWLAPEDLGRAPHSGKWHEAPEGTSGLTERVDLVPAMPPVWSQGTTGSCVAFALAACVPYLLGRAGCAAETPSFLALYYEARRRIGTTDHDSGALISDGVEVLREEGWAPEDLWPYRESLFSARPPDDVYAAGRIRRLVSSEPIAIDSDSIQWELASGHPVVVGLRITRAWDDPQGGILPEPSGPSTANHAVTLVGYDAPGGFWRVRNSWGAWAEGGHAWLPWSWTTLPWCGEAYALRAVRRIL